MKIKLNSILKNIYGEPLKSQRDKPRKKPDDPKEKEILTLRSVIVVALLTDFPNEKLSGEDKLERYRLAMMIQDASADIELSSEKIVMIKESIGKAWNTLVAGQAWETIEP